MAVASYRVLLAAAVVLVGACGSDSGQQVASSGEPVPYASITVDGESGRVEVVDSEGHWTMREESSSGETCVHMRTGNGGGSNCAESGDGLLGVLGSANSAFPVEVPDDDNQAAGASAPAPQRAEFAYVWGRVPIEVTHVRVTTSLGDRFVVPALGADGLDVRYFVVSIPAAQAPLEMRDDTVEFTEDASVDDDVEWIDQLAYLAADSMRDGVDTACVELLIDTYNDVAVDDLQVEPEPTPEALEIFNGRLEAAFDSMEADSDGICEGSPSVEQQQQILDSLDSDLVALLQEVIDGFGADLRADN